MQKVTRFLHKLADVLDDVLAYILTIVGILASNYLADMKTHEAINIQLDWWRIGLSAVIALMVVGKSEQLDGDGEMKSKSREGRKKRFLIRMANALSQGITWSVLLNLGA